MSGPDAAVTRLWLDSLHAIGRPLAHEVKNALNGVSVNLEVVRSRAGRPDSPAASVSRFAEAASEQLSVVTELCEALLDVVRPAASHGELMPLVGRLAAMLRAVARPEGGDVRVSVVGAPPATALDGAELRAIVAALLVGAFERGGRLSCEVGGDGEPTLRLEREGSALGEPPPDAREAAARAGVRLLVDDGAWTATFPARAGLPADPDTNPHAATNA